MAVPAHSRMGSKRRVDQALVDLGLVENRARAQALIMAGKVWAGDTRIAKAGDYSPEGAHSKSAARTTPGSPAAASSWRTPLPISTSPCALICLDVGASTGGFTDVLLAHGAARVHAVDVGHGQLAWKLRTDPRVVVHERPTPATSPPRSSPSRSSAIVCDASFIGLATVLPAPLALCVPGALAVALIKPQFEAGPGQVGKGGVVRDPAVHRAVCARVRGWCRHCPAGRCSASPTARSPGPKVTASS